MEIDQEKLATLVNQGSRNIVEAIVRDLTGRVALGDDWEDAKPEIKAEIRAEWRSIARETLAVFGRDLLKEVLDPVMDAIEEELPGLVGPPDAEDL